MATSDPAAMLNAAVSGENVAQVIIALQSEVLKLNNVLNQSNQDIHSQTATNKALVDFEIASLLGDVNGVKATVDALNKNVKDEIIKTSGMMNKMKEEVIEACSAGGVIDMSIQQSVSQSVVFGVK